MRPHHTYLAPAFVALTLSSAQAQDTPLQVLATIGMIADIAQQVAGDCAQVDTLIGAGIDPHDYSATPADVQALSRAGLILYADRALEERLADVLDQFGDRTPTLGVIRATFADSDLLADPDAPDAIDPHVWMNVALWARIAPTIADAIVAERPDCGPAIAENVVALTAQLDALHDWVGDAIATIPAGQRLLVTAHDAFNYLADAYGIEASEAIEGISSASEASIADIREVADFIVARNVQAVFVESTINPRTIQALVAEAQSRGQDVRIGGTLFADALGDAGTAEGTYIGMIRANTETIVTALGGGLPDWPDTLADWAESWSIGD
jgi:manganese/zinc/iron transport system substrate-binding protein